MLKKLLCIILATASIRVATCDIECFIQQMNNPLKANSLAGIDKACANYPFLVESIREIVKNCEVNKVSVDGVESFFIEFCASDSGIRQNFINTVDCFFPHFSGLTCMPKTIMGGESSLEALKEECKVRHEMTRCIVDGAGKPCGAEEFTMAAVKAFESYINGICAEAGGAAANTVTVWGILLCMFLFVMNCM